ncbi:MAG: TfoX/Sxy family protein [Acidobacteria bacterium]|nr:TfoX/Sxy family protein [Acidobacteriota bacterium]
MAFDVKLAERVRKLVAGAHRFDEKRMFGGLAFMVNGHMCCGVLKDDLVLRVGPQEHEKLKHHPHARPMDFTGRPLRGFLYVGPAGLRSARDLRVWVQRSLQFVDSLPPK